MNVQILKLAIVGVAVGAAVGIGLFTFVYAKAQFYLDFVEAENSMGFHAPAEAVRILGESINFTRMGLMALTGVQPVHTNIAVKSGG